VGSSLFKKAHKTHSLAQRAGEPYPTEPGGASSAARLPGASGDRVLAQFAQLCELVPEVESRAALLGVAPDLDAAWQHGKRLPLLRARRKAIEAALRAAAEARPRPSRADRPSSSSHSTS
jgi:hypothetical protein